MVTITELMESIQKLQSVSDISKLEKIAQVLDEDRDGVIDKDVLMEVMLIDSFVNKYKSTGWHKQICAVGQYASKSCHRILSM